MNYNKGIFHKSRWKRFICSFLTVLFLFHVAAPQDLFSLIHAEATSEKAVSSLYVTYTGPTITSPVTLSANDFQVTAVYDNGTSETVSDYIFTSSLDITAEGDYTISVFYKNKNASCTVSYYSIVSQKYYNITFETNGGSHINPMMGILAGSTLSALPESPTRDGYWFRGWYPDTTYQTEFDFNQRITQDYTLYALWEAKENANSNLLSTTISFPTFDAKLSVDLTNQAYGAHVRPYGTPIANSEIKMAAENISKTSAYFAFRFDMADFTYNSQIPLKTIITLPDNYNPEKVTVYFTPDERTIQGACQGSAYSQHSYTFLAYEPGSYIVMCSNTNQSSTSTPAPTAPAASPSAVPTNTPAPTVTEAPTAFPGETPGSAASVSMELSDSVKVKKQATATLSYHNFEASPMAPEELIFNWISSNPSIATVDEHGVVTGIKPGTVTITAISDDELYSASHKIKVVADTIAVKSIKVNKSTVRIKKGKTFTIKATVSPSNATNKKVKFVSSNKKIATVTSKGKVKGIKKGSCTISVKAVDGSKVVKKVKIKVS